MVGGVERAALVAESSAPAGAAACIDAFAGSVKDDRFSLGPQRGEPSDLPAISKGFVLNPPAPWLKVKNRRHASMDREL
jgi:hypothetical protein